METHTLPDQDMEAYSFAVCVCVRAVHAPLRTHMHAHTNSIINKAWELLLCER